MDILKMMKQAMNMKSKMKEIQSSLAGKSASVEYEGVNVTISCDLKKVQCKLDPSVMNQNVEKLSQVISHAFEQALSQAKQTSAGELKQAMGGMDMSGLTDMLT